MGPMPRRVPDEYFRSDEREAEPVASPKEGSDSGGATRLESLTGVTSRSLRAQGGIAPRFLVAGIFLLFLIGVLLGRIAIGLTDTGAPPNGPSEQPSQTSPAPVPSMIPYDGSVRLAWPDRVNGECRAGTGHDLPGHLLDGDPDTIWRCAGTGVGASLTFSFDAPTELVGVRVINGNTVGEDRFLLERRILSVHWEFPDGSWLVQGFAANDRSPQEIRFPPITVEGPVTLTVQGSTIAGDPSPIFDAISIASLDFLTSA